MRTTRCDKCLGIIEVLPRFTLHGVPSHTESSDLCDKCFEELLVKLILPWLGYEIIYTMSGEWKAVK